MEIKLNDIFIGVIIIGFIILVVATINNLHLDFETTEGQIIGVSIIKPTGFDRASLISIQYEVNGQIYNESAKVGNVNYSLNDTLDIQYNPENPSDFIIGNNMWFFWGFLAYVIFVIIVLQFQKRYYRKRGIKVGPESK